MIEHDWLDHDFIDEHTVGFDAGRRVRAAVDARADRRGDRHRRDGRSARRPSGGARRRPASCCTRAASSITRNGVQNVLGAINIVLASGRIGRPKLRLRHDHRPGATARAAASTARSATSSPAGATSRTPSTARYVAGVWGVDEEELPGPGRRRLRDVPQDRRGRDQGAALDLLQPDGLAARQQLRHALPREARVLRRDRLLPERDGAPRRHRAARLAAGGGRGHGHADRGPRHQDQQGGRLPRATRGRTGASSRTSRAALGRAARLHVRRARARSSTSCASRRKGGVADYSGITYEKIERQMGVFWPCRDDPRPAADRPPRHAAAVRAGLVEPGREGRRAVLLPRRQGALQRRRLRAAGRGRRRRVPASS